MNKKKIIIVVVIFLLLGTMVYSFASSPRDLEEGQNNDTPPTEQPGGSQSGDEDETDDITIPVVGGNDSNGPTIDYLALAQQAVLKAETSLTQSDVDAAKDAIEDVVDGNTEELVDRITTVQNIIDFETLLTNLENKTNATTTKVELDDVRNSEETTATTTTLNELVQDLTNVQINVEKITNLTIRYSNVLNKLNDISIPSIVGVTDGEYTKGPVILTVTDNSSFTATLSKDGAEAINYINGTEIKEDGNYVLTVIDSSFNDIVVKFTIETVKPEVIDITQVYEDKEDGRIKVTIKTSEEIFGDLLGNSEWRKVNDKNEYYNYYYNTQEVTISFQDKAGNEGSYTFKVDKTKPTVQVTMSNNNGHTSTNEDVTVTLVASEDILDIDGWTKIDSKTFTKLFTSNGKYSVDITDIVGNKNTINFEVKRLDKVPPILTITDPESYDMKVNSEYIEKGYYAYDELDKDLTYRVTMSYEFLPKDSSKWDIVDSIDTSVLGTYRITYSVSDKAGNISSATREFRVVDIDNPVFDGVDNTKHYDKAIEVLITDYQLKEVIVEILNNGDKTTNIYNVDDSSFTITFDEEATYHITATDSSGNKNDIWFAIDTTFPIIKGNANNGNEVDLDSTVQNIYGYYKYVDLTFEDKFLTSVSIVSDTINEVYDRNDFVSNGNNEYFKFNKVIDTEGSYIIKAIDKFGHETVAEIVIDNDPSIISIIDITEDGYTNNGGVQISDVNEFEVYIKLNDEEKIKTSSIKQPDGKYFKSFNINWMGEGKYEIIVIDKAGNRSSQTFIFDNEFLGVDAANILVDGDSNNQRVYYATYGDKINVYARFKEELRNIPTFTLINNGKTYIIDEKDIIVREEENGEYLYSAFYEIVENTTMTDGEITMHISNIQDKAGNSYKDITKPDNGHIVYLDTNPASMVYSTVDFDGTGITPKVENSIKTYYVENGDTFVFRIRFSEELLENPILNLGNKSIKLELVEKYVTEEGKYIYQGQVEINEEDNFKNGSLSLILSNVKDLAGNKTTDIRDLDQTITSNKRTVIVDNTLVTVNPLYVLARDDVNYRTSISDGEYLRVEANFDKELAQLPTLFVGEQSKVFDKCNFNNDKSLYVCVADIKIDNEVAKLEEGSIIPIKVDNVVDWVGNSSSFGNEYITKFYKDGKLVYDQVKFENPFVSMTFHNSTNYKINVDNGNNDLPINEAKVGDNVRVFARFNQNIDIDNFKPLIVIGGISEELKLSNVYSDGTKDYGADIMITNEMNLIPEQEISFVIKNIVLENGNTLPYLNQDDITSSTLSGVVYKK